VIPAYVQAQIDAKMNELKGMGFVRQPRQVKTPPPPPAAKGAPGAPHPTPVPGAGGSDGTTSAGAKLAATLALG